MLVIYELKHREERFEQTSRVLQESGLGFSQTTVRGNTQKKYQNFSALDSGRGNLAQDSRFSLKTSVRGDYSEQLYLFTDMPIEMRKAIAKPSAIKLPQRKFKSQFRASTTDEQAI